MANPLTSPLSGIVEPVVTQEQKGSFMQCPIQSAQIGQQITQIIQTSPEPQALLASIAKTLGEIFQGDTCLIVALGFAQQGAPAAQPADRLIANPGVTTQLALWCADDDQTTLPPGYQAQLLEHPVLKDGLTGTQPLAIPDLQASDSWEGRSWHGEVLHARAILRIHTRFQTAVNGMIILGRSQPYEWTTQEKELLSSVSESVAIAISQVQLHQQVQAATRRQTLLNQLSLAIHSNLNLHEILQMAIAGIAQALKVDRSLLLLFKYSDPLFKSQPSAHLPKTKVTVAYEWLDESAKDTERASSLLNQSFWLSDSSWCQQAFKEAPEPMVIADQRFYSPNLDLERESRSIFDQKMMPALLMVPLVGTPSKITVTTTLLGFLVLQHHHPRPWHSDELDVVKWVSRQISATLIQNQTLQHVQSLVKDRTAQLQRSLEVQAKLYEKTRQQIDQLQQLNLLKEEFLSTMSHELRTPLTAMSLAIRMLRQPNVPLERRDKYLSILEQECNKEIDLINDLLSLQQLESNQSQLQAQNIDLISLIKELTQSFEEKWADKRLTLTVDCAARSQSVGKAKSLMLNTDPDSLNRILLELLTNAGKYSDPDTTVCLQVTHQVQQSLNQVVLTLTNTGPGISPADLKHIFDKFRRGQGVTQQAVKGTGLGLALVKCLVEHLNGTIEVSSSPSENSQTFLTSFTLTLPQFQQQHQSLEQSL